MQTVIIFDTLLDAVKVMKTFGRKFLSNKKNMTFLKKTAKSNNVQSGNKNIKKEIIYIYFELKSINKLSFIQVLIKSQKKTKTWKDSPHHTLLNSLVMYLKNVSKEHSLTAVFVCSRSAQIFHRLLQSYQPGTYFTSWTDLTSLARQTLDTNDLKAVCYDPGKLSQLVGEEISPGTEVTAMEKFFSGFKTIEQQVWQVEKGNYITVVLNMDLIKITEGESHNTTVATIGFDSSSGLAWSTGIKLDNGLTGEVAKMTARYVCQRH